jgi:predicted phosphodiesterase
MGKWQRVLAVGCSHGSYLDTEARKHILKAADKLKPHLIVHLGDWMDATALRAGAATSNDAYAPVAPDLEAGLDFLRELRDRAGELWVFDGNHEARVQRLASSSQAILAELGRLIIARVHDELRRLRASHLPYHGVWSYRVVGGYRLMHGVGAGGPTALRQHVDCYGSCVIAHTHAAHMECGRRADGAVGISVGTLADIRKLEYANTRLNTMRWSHGFAWGEFKGERGIFWLHRQPAGVPWVLPF